MNDPGGVVREIGTEAARTLAKEILPAVLQQLRRTWPPKRSRLLKQLPHGLRDCVTDLRACFLLPGPASFNHVVSNLGTSSDQQRFVRSRLSMAHSWFKAWDEMQAGAGSKITPECFVAGLAGLNDLLFWTSDAGEELIQLVESTTKDHMIRKPMHALSDKYNGFLTSYEAFLRRLPVELGVRGHSLPVGMEKYFSRLRYLST